MPIASIGKILSRLLGERQHPQSDRVNGCIDIPDSHRAAPEHLLLVGSEKVGCCGRAEMEEVVLQAGDALGKDVEPLGRQEGQDGSLGGNAILEQWCQQPSHLTP